MELKREWVEIKVRDSPVVRARNTDIAVPCRAINTDGKMCGTLTRIETEDIYKDIDHLCLKHLKDYVFGRGIAIKDD